MKETAVVILAGTREAKMKSNLAKVLHPLCGVSMLSFSLGAARHINPAKTAIVVGEQGEKIREEFSNPGSVFINEKEDSPAVTLSLLRQFLNGVDGVVVVLPGDAPLLRGETLKKLLLFYEDLKPAVALLSAIGREKVDPLIYCFNSVHLLSVIDGFKEDDFPVNFHLGELMKLTAQMGGETETFFIDDPDEVLVVNDRVDLAMANRILRDRIIKKLMLEGVTFIDPQVTYIDKRVKIGRDTVVYPNCYLQGKTIIGEECIIEAGTKIVDSEIGNSVIIKVSSVISESIIKEGATIGPFAHLRPQTELAKQVKIGNFVEVKKSKVGEGSKASHLTYIGDSEIGKNVNIGCGTITCNYDGKNKYRTIIEDGVFVGSDTQFIAPVKIGEGSTIGAGSTITKDVPPNSLALSRTKQKILRKLRVKEEGNKS